MKDLPHSSGTVIKAVANDVAEGATCEDPLIFAFYFDPGVVIQADFDVLDQGFPWVNKHSDSHVVGMG